jgi:hypothetical protein
VTRLEKANNRFGVKVNIGINKHKVFGVSLLHKPANRNIPGTVNKAFILRGVNHQLVTTLNHKNLKAKDARQVWFKA